MQRSPLGRPRRENAVDLNPALLILWRSGMPCSAKWLILSCSLWLRTKLGKSSLETRFTNLRLSLRKIFTHSSTFAHVFINETSKFRVRWESKFFCNSIHLEGNIRIGVSPLKICKLSLLKAKVTLSFDKLGIGQIHNEESAQTDDVILCGSALNSASQRLLNKARHRPTLRSSNLTLS